MEFVSRFRKYRIWLRPRRTGHDASGGRFITDDGIVCKFDEGRFQTDDKEIIKLLKSNPRHGIDFSSIEQDQTSGLSQEAQEIIDKEQAGLETTATSCPYCSSKFDTKSALKSHIRAKHKEQ